MSRRQRANDEFGGVFGPQDDSDLFAAQLVAHGRNARTAHAHAGADGIYALVVGNYSDLGAHARIASGSLDFKQALFDLGYFVFEQLTNKFSGGTGQNDLPAPSRMINLEIGRASCRDRVCQYV